MANEEDDVQKIEDISYVMVDGNNMPPEMAKVVMNTDQSKNRSARNSFLKGSFYSNADLIGVPLPSQLKTN